MRKLAIITITLLFGLAPLACDEKKDEKKEEKKDDKKDAKAEGGEEKKADGGW